MNINDFDFDLPEELIAQTPLEKRSESRLLILDPKTEELEDRHFYNIIDELEAGDALVLNNTRVLPARLHGERAETGGHIELLLLKDMGQNRWETLARPARKMKVGKAPRKRRFQHKKRNHPYSDPEFRERKKKVNKKEKVLTLD